MNTVISWSVFIAITLLVELAEAQIYNEFGVGGQLFPNVVGENESFSGRQAGVLRVSSVNDAWGWLKGDATFQMLTCNINGRIYDGDNLIHRKFSLFSTEMGYGVRIYPLGHFRSYVQPYIAVSPVIQANFIYTQKNEDESLDTYRVFPFPRHFDTMLYGARTAVGGVIMLGSNYGISMQVENFQVLSEGRGGTHFMNGPRAMLSLVIHTQSVSEANEIKPLYRQEPPSVPKQIETQTSVVAEKSEAAEIKAPPKMEAVTVTDPESPQEIFKELNREQIKTEEINVPPNKSIINAD